MEYRTLEEVENLSPEELQEIVLVEPQERGFLVSDFTTQESEKVSNLLLERHLEGFKDRRVIFLGPQPLVCTRPLPSDQRNAREAIEVCQRIMDLVGYYPDLRHPVDAELEILMCIVREAEKDAEIMLGLLERETDGQELVLEGDDIFNQSTSSA